MKSNRGSVWLTLVLAAAGSGCGGESPPPASTEMPIPAAGAETQAKSGSSQVVGQVERPPGTALPIVMLEPHTPLEPGEPSGPVEMDQYGRAFFPPLLLAREGQVVRFRNSEDELHNVNVHDEAGITIFNVGMPILGGTYDHTFERAGDYAVACNVHQEMAALIVVTATPFATTTDRDGRFSFADVPHGTYDLVVRRGQDRDLRVVEVTGARTELYIDAV